PHRARDDAGRQTPSRGAGPVYEEQSGVARRDLERRGELYPGAVPAEPHAGTSIERRCYESSVWTGRMAERHGVRVYRCVCSQDSERRAEGTAVECSGGFGPRFRNGEAHDSTQRRAEGARTFEDTGWESEVRCVCSARGRNGDGVPDETESGPS